jgi:hypothetical protein
MSEERMASMSVETKTKERRMMFGLGEHNELYVKRNGQYVLASNSGLGATFQSFLNEATTANAGMELRREYGEAKVVPVSVHMKTRYVWVALKHGTKRKMVKTSQLSEEAYSVLSEAAKA